LGGLCSSDQHRRLFGGAVVRVRSRRCRPWLSVLTGTLWARLRRTAGKACGRLRLPRLVGCPARGAFALARALQRVRRVPPYPLRSVGCVPEPVREAIARRRRRVEGRGRSRVLLHQRLGLPAPPGLDRRAGNDGAYPAYRPWLMVRSVRLRSGQERWVATRTRAIKAVGPRWSTRHPAGGPRWSERHGGRLDGAVMTLSTVGSGRSAGRDRLWTVWRGRRLGLLVDRTGAGSPRCSCPRGRTSAPRWCRTRPLRLAAA
jgi:hypothetical protein